METAVYERAVYYYETDRMDCVHHSNYIRWFEEARIFFMQEKGFPYDQMEASGILSPVLAAQAEYCSMCRFGEQVSVTVRIESYTGTKIGFFYQVHDKETGALRCQGHTLHCFIRAKNGRPVSLRRACPAYDQRVKELFPQA